MDYKAALNQTTHCEGPRNSSKTAISIVIPHFLGDVIHSCVESIFKHTDCSSTTIIVVDDQPRADGSLSSLKKLHPQILIAPCGAGKGFGAACNAGIEAATTELIVILNNDTVVSPGWLEKMLGAASEFPSAAAFQPTVRSLSSTNQFDYAGGAGGELDALGFPYAWGRVFDSVEEDTGQYRESRPVFWASGCALLLRKTPFLEVARFDTAFHMHMEEIDLAWRLQLAGHEIRSCPDSVIYHVGGGSLPYNCFRKIYLNHRNSLVLLIKNLPLGRLLWSLPLRLLLELIASGAGVVAGSWRRAAAPLLGMAWCLLHSPSLLRRRRRARVSRRIPDRTVVARLKPFSAVWGYFARGRRTAGELRLVEASPPPDRTDPLEEETLESS